MPLENESQILKIHLHPSHIDPHWHEENNKLIESKLNKLAAGINAINNGMTAMANSLKQGNEHGNTKTR